MRETWKPIPGIDDRYEVSNLGNIRSWCRLDQRAKTRATKPHRIKPYDRGLGYYFIRTGSGETRASTTVHRAVLEAFVGPCPDGMEACHNNGIKADNRLKNLRWDTPKNNVLDRRAHGTAGVGEKNPSAKLSESEVVRIRELGVGLGRSFTEIAQDYGVTKTNISMICRGKTWAHAGGPINQVNG